MISIIDIMDKAQENVRPLIEGEQYYKSDLLMCVGCKEKNGSRLSCVGLAAQTSGVFSYPHEVECLVDLELPYGKRVLHLECKCPAGKSSKCKHCIALLLHLNRTNEDELEDLSCTDLEQQWGKLKATHYQSYGAKKLAELCHVPHSDPVTVANVTEELKAKWRKILLDSAPLSEYSMFYSGVRTNYSSPCSKENAESMKAEFQLFVQKLLTLKSWLLFKKLVMMTRKFKEESESACKQFYEENVQTTLSSSVRIGASFSQGGESWLNERKVRITGSICYSLFTYFSNKKPDWDKKFNSLYENTFHGNIDTLHGLRCEPLARDKYMNQEQVKVIETGLLVRPELPWLGFSPDGVVTNDLGEPTKLIEIKSPKEGVRLSCSEMISLRAMKSLDADGKLKKKHPHYGQIQLGMLVMGIEQTDYLVYSAIEDNFILIPVQFDMKFADEMASSLCCVYFKQILPRLQSK